MEHSFPAHFLTNIQVVEKKKKENEQRRINHNQMKSACPRRTCLHVGGSVATCCSSITQARCLALPKSARLKKNKHYNLLHCHVNVSEWEEREEPGCIMVLRQSDCVSGSRAVSSSTFWSLCVTWLTDSEALTQHFPFENKTRLREMRGRKRIWMTVHCSHCKPARRAGKRRSEGNRWRESRGCCAVNVACVQRKGGRVGWTEGTDGRVGEEEVERRGVMCADPSSSVTP